jgi:hypothetical protein
MSAAVRAFARDHLVESAGADAVIARHGEWFATVAERFGTEHGADVSLPLSLLTPDEGDVLAALRSSMESGDPSTAYRILVALGTSWTHIGRPEVGEAAAIWLSGRSPSDGEEMWSGAVLRSCHERIGDPSSPIHRFADEAIAIAELVGDAESPRLLAPSNSTAGTSVVFDMAEQS